jgi:hypothetical protein
VTPWSNACAEFEIAELELLEAAAEVDFLNCCADHLGRPHLSSSPRQEDAVTDLLEAHRAVSAVYSSDPF